jgi:hypothetical protein
VLESFTSIESSLKYNMLMALVEVSRKSGIIVWQNEEFTIVASLMCEAAVPWEISRTPTVLFYHWMARDFAALPNGD